MRSSIHHIAIRVRDLKASKRFYAEVLGSPPVKSAKDIHGALRSVWFKVGRVILMLECSQARHSSKKNKPSRSSFHKEKNPGIHLIAFEIPLARRETLKRLFSKRGIQIVQETSYSFYIQDLEGNRLGFSHYPRRSKSFC